MSNYNYSVIVRLKQKSHEKIVWLHIGYTIKLFHKQKWCRNSELNQGHRDFQSLALPTELLRHTLFNLSLELVEQALLFSFSFRFTPLGSYCGTHLLNLFRAIIIFSAKPKRNLSTL